MKRVFPLILAAALMLSLVACGGQSASQSPNVTQSSEVLSQNNDELSETEVFFDELEYENVRYNYGYGVDIELQFRNITETDMDYVIVRFQGLDTNGDIVVDAFNAVENLRAGQAGWFRFQTNETRGVETIEELAEIIDTVYAYSYQVTIDEDGEEETYDGEFSEPISIKVAEVPPKEK